MIGKVRSVLYKTAAALGDLQAVRRGQVMKRIQRRIVGRAMGRLLGRLFR